ncbi:MAG: D-aminoacyl-tRNA deacylase [Planctomycetota bacterium]|nr:MAG: D-aminoacyl-tRNA deacylase [Planctomycetota bacterium]
MIVVAQRVSRARVWVDDEVVGEIERGLCLLTCALNGDDAGDIEWLANKVANLRVFPKDADHGDRSLLDVNGAALVVPQFTLAADWRKGRRPSFLRAAPPEQGAALVQHFAACLERAGVHVAQGRFGANMQVELRNDGPFTLVLDSAQRHPPVGTEPHA